MGGKIAFAVFLLNINVIWGSENDTDDFRCSGILCQPSNYNRLETPNQGITVYVNFEESQNALKKVIDHDMVIMFEANLFLIWKDPRIRLSKDIIYESLPDATLNRIWSPKLTVENQVNKERQDPGKLSKNAKSNLS